VRRILALTCACLLGAPALAAAAQGPLVVVLDPGHGGKWPHDGAHGGRGLHEKVIALQVAQKTKTALEALGATVILTREADDDIPLAERARIANDSGADVFLSIHCNSMERREDRKITRGVETYFLSPDPTDAEARMLAKLENGGPDAVPLPRASSAVAGILNDLALGQARNDSAALAQIVQRQMVRETRAPSRGVRQAPFLVLSGTRMPSALVEIGFISHPQEGRRLLGDRYQERIAQALADGVRDFADRVLARRLYAQVRPEEQKAHEPKVDAAGVVAAPSRTR
jgi:N-acetylmuramoyl-L-alanine amidase